MIELPLLLEPEQLQAQLNQLDKHLLIIDMRAPDRYVKGHIAGAVNLQYADLIRAEPPVGGLLADRQQLSQILSAIGLTPQHHVIAYDDEGNGRAARLLWTLDALGHQHFSLLNGGFTAWHEEGYKLQSGQVTTTPSDYQAQLSNPDVVADRHYILSRLQQSDFLPLDTRSPAEYYGQNIRAARGGHIPGAVNFDWLEAIDQDRNLRFKPDAELLAQLQALGVSTDKEIVTYCQTHHRSSHTYIVLKHLGFTRIRGYHGAWSEWGNDASTPIAQ